MLTFFWFCKRYGKPAITAEYIDCLVGAKAIKAAKKSFTKVYVVITAHRFFAMSVSKILKKPEILLDAHLLELRVLQNNQPNRVYLLFDGKVCFSSRRFSLLLICFCCETLGARNRVVDSARCCVCCDAAHCSGKDHSG